MNQTPLKILVLATFVIGACATAFAVNERESAEHERDAARDSLRWMAPALKESQAMLISERASCEREAARADSIAILLDRCRRPHVRACVYPRGGTTLVAATAPVSRDTTEVRRAHHWMPWLIGGAIGVGGFVLGRVTHSDEAGAVVTVIQNVCGGGGRSARGGPGCPPNPHHHKRGCK